MILSVDYLTTVLLFKIKESREHSVCLLARSPQGCQADIPFFAFGHLVGSLGRLHHWCGSCHLIYTGVLAGMEAYGECQENYKRSRVLKFRND